VDVDGLPAEWQTVPGTSEERVMLYLHGGGYIFGSSYTHRPLTVALGEATGMQVLSLNYRLAPENPFPAGLEDCARAYQWLLSKGFKPSNIVIAGDSAGGNLTLTTILKLRDNGVPLPKGAVCFSPDVGGLSLSHAETDPILADLGLFWWIGAYLGVENPANPKNPLVSPLFGDLGGFPPLLVQATPLEMLFEHAKRFVGKVQEAGGDVTLQTWDGMVHDFQLFFFGVFPESREAIDKAGEWVRKLYAPDQAGG
jgi:acetyl esterase/lipase